jgi:hypothetical protein
MSDDSAGSPGDATPREGGTGSSATDAPPKRRGFFRRHWLASTIAILVLVPSFGFTVWAGIALTFSYSEGTRTGYVQKLSRKGWLCKTWEGELAMTAQPGVAPVIFAFTVRSDSVAKAITAVEGRQVTLEYREHRGVPSSCFGETGHFVEGVRAVSP